MMRQIHIRSAMPVNSRVQEHASLRATWKITSTVPLILVTAKQ